MATIITNLLTNPSAETNTTNAAVSGGFTLSRDTVEFFSGAASFEILTDGTGAQNKRFLIQSATGLALSATGLTFYGALYLKGDAGNQVAVDVQLSYTDASSEIVAGTIYTLTADWVRGSSPVTPADDGKTVDRVTINVRPVTAAIFTFFADAAIINQGSVVSPYFDGDTTDTETDLYAWTGTAHASTSTHTHLFAAGDGYTQQVSRNFQLRPKAVT